jgi:hypothetical protein
MSTTGCSDEFLHALLNNLPPPTVSFVVSAKKKHEVRRLMQLGLPKPMAYEWVSGHFYATYLLNLFTFQTPIIYDNSALLAELLIYKGDLSVKSNSYLITFKDADLLGPAFEMLKGVEKFVKNPDLFISSYVS